MLKNPAVLKLASSAAAGSRIRNKRWRCLCAEIRRLLSSPAGASSSATATPRAAGHGRRIGFTMRPQRKPQAASRKKRRRDRVQGARLSGSSKRPAPPRRRNYRSSATLTGRPVHGQYGPDFAQQRSAAGHGDALVDYVGGDLGLAALERDPTYGTASPARPCIGDSSWLSWDFGRNAAATSRPAHARSALASTAAWPCRSPFHRSDVASPISRYMAADVGGDRLIHPVPRSARLRVSQAFQRDHADLGVPPPYRRPLTRSARSPEASADRRRHRLHRSATPAAPAGSRRHGSHGARRGQPDGTHSAISGPRDICFGLLAPSRRSA